jgi:hypothetical protein
MTQRPDIIREEDLVGLPGADLVLAGLNELREGEPSLRPKPLLAQQATRPDFVLAP